jgi:hypothetical protein
MGPGRPPPSKAHDTSLGHAEFPSPGRTPPPCVYHVPPSKTCLIRERAGGESRSLLRNRPLQSSCQMFLPELSVCVGGNQARKSLNACRTKKMTCTVSMISSSPRVQSFVTLPHRLGRRYLFPQWGQCWVRGKGEASLHACWRPNG